MGNERRLPHPGLQDQSVSRTLNPCDRMAFKNGRRYADANIPRRISGISGRYGTCLSVHEGQWVSTAMPAADGERSKERKARVQYETPAVELIRDVATERSEVWLRKTKARKCASRQRRQWFSVREGLKNLPISPILPV